MKLPFLRYIKRHHISRAALTVGVPVVAILFFVVGAALRLLMGPVSLGPVSGSLAEAVKQALPGINLQFDQAAVEWTRDQGRVNLVILGARMFDSGGRIVAQAPKADIDLAAAPLMSGKFVVQRITLVGVQLALVRTTAGGLRLGLEADKNGDDIIARLSDIINAHQGPSTLQSFAVRDARLAIYDEITGLFLVAPRASLSIRAKGDALGAAFDADVEISGRKAHTTADLTLPPHDGPMSGTLSVTGLDLRALAANAPRFAGLKTLALVANLSTSFHFAPGGRIAGADFNADAAGEIPFALLKGKVLHLKTLRLAGHYDGIAHRIAVSSAAIDSKELQAGFRAESTLTLDADGKIAMVAGHLAAVKLAIDAPGVFQHAVVFNALDLTGSYTMGIHRLEVTKLSLTAPALALNAAGIMTFAEKQSPGLALTGTIGALPVQTLLTYWPVFAAPGAREWIAGNVFAGSMGPAQFQTAITPGMMDQSVLPDAALKLTLAMKGIEANYMTGLTHLTGVNGSATVTGDNFTADFTAGRVGPLIVKSGHAVIPALHLHGTVATFSAHVDGTMPDIMTLIDMKPLGYPTRFGIKPSDTAGAASVDLLFHVPMLPDLPVDMVGIGVKAQATGFAVTLGKLHLGDGAVNFDIDNDKLRQSGTALIADQRFNFDWTETFKSEDPVTTRINAKGLLTPAVRAALGIDIGKIVTGSWPVTVVITGHRGALTQADATLDMTPATIAVPIINLGKPAGEAASAHVVTNFAPGDHMSDQVIHVTGANLSASGTASFEKDGGLARLDFANVKRGTLNDLGFTMTRGAGGDVYDAHGHSLDGSSVGRNASCNAPAGTVADAPAKTADDTPTGSYRVIAHLDRLVLCDGVAIAPFNMDLSGVGERPAALSLTGGLSKTATLTAGLENTPQGRKLTVTAGDAGLLGRALFSFDGLRGGALTVTATLPGRASDTPPAGAAPDFQGALTIANFKMVNESFFARLFAAGSLTGIGDLLQNEGISMEKVDMPFSSKNSVIAIKGAIFTGHAVGGTADGYIDRPHNQVAIKGSLVPAYGLNSIVSNVPLLGDLLASKKGEGIFGVAYSMSGNADQPSLSVNVASALAPGILRRLFEGNIPNAANAPTNRQTPDSAQAAAPAPQKPAGSASQ